MEYKSLEEKQAEIKNSIKDTVNKNIQKKRFTTIAKNKEAKNPKPPVEEPQVPDVEKYKPAGELFNHGDTKIIINGNEFQINPECKDWYAHDYIGIQKAIEDGAQALPQYRYLILNDLWFIVHFVMGIPGANRPFVVKACREVEQGPNGYCLDLWARFHYKSTIKTKARNMQRILKNPECCIMIASHTRPAAKKFLRPIMREFEENEFLKACFPDVLYENPRKQSPKWSEDDGIVVKRKNKSRSESTVEAHGIKEGMPIGSHFDFIDLDDLETKADVKNPDVVQKGRDAVDLCLFLLTENGAMDVTGTPYSHLGIYIPHIIEKVRANGEPKYLYRRKPGTEDGTKDGKPVMVTKEVMDDIYAELAKDGYGEYNFNSQVLINPTPQGTQKLNSELLQDIEPKDIPLDLVYFMVIDPAGDDEENQTTGDDWGIWVIGVDPKEDEIGIRKRYIVDGFLDVLSESAAPDLLGMLFLKNRQIIQTGYEYKSVTPAWLPNFCAYVRKKGFSLFEDPKMNMVVRLKDGGRQKGRRIVSAISRPLNHRSIFISSDVPDQYNMKLREEMDKFGFWGDNGLDAMAYLDDLIRDFDFSNYIKRDDKHLRQLDSKRASDYNPMKYARQ